MAGPDYGALGATFKITRVLQVVSLLGCIGMAANFIAEMVNQNDIPSKELVGTLSVVCALRGPRTPPILILVVDLHCRPLLCHYLHPSHRQHSSILTKCRYGWHDAHCPVCRGYCRWSTLVVPQLPGHRFEQRGRIGGRIEQ